MVLFKGKPGVSDLVQDRRFFRRQAMEVLCVLASG
jgi:hypothetical protein